MIINKKLINQSKETFKKKNVLFGLKFKFLGRNPQGILISEDNAINRTAALIYEAFYCRGLIVTNVFFKKETLDFFIATEKDLISLNSLDKNWVNEYKHNWGKVFFNATVGQYTLYPDQYEDITDRVGEIVEAFDSGKKLPDFWYKERTGINTNTECEECGHITHGKSAWKFEFHGKTYIENINLSEDDTWDLDPLIEQFGETFSDSIMEGTEVCPECNSENIYPALNLK